jgi:2-iminobutanoate/2-iminopropanoate deaminase
MALRKEIISTPSAPAAIGPYSQAVVAGDFIFISGQIPLDPETMKMVEGDVAVQTERVMKSICEILKVAGSSLENVVKTSVLLADMGDFETVNGVYGSFFKSDPPARATFQAAGLPKGALVEIETIALKSS